MKSIINKMKKKKYYYIEWQHAEKDGNLRMAEYYKEMYEVVVMDSNNWYVKKLKQFPIIYLN